MSTNPKIELSNKDDVRYIENLLRRNALEILENESVDDKNLKNVAAALTNKFIDKLMESTGHGLIVNGLDYSKVMNTEEEFEPLNSKLVKEVERLQQKYDALQLKVCNKRKDLPEKVDLVTKKILDFKTKIESQNEIENTTNLDFEKLEKSLDIEVPELNSNCVNKLNQSGDMIKQLCQNLPLTSGMLEEVSKCFEVKDTLIEPTPELSQYLSQRYVFKYLTRHRKKTKHF